MIEPISYECELVEFEDEKINHYLHHFDELDMQLLSFDEDYEPIALGSDVIEEIIYE